METPALFLFVSLVIGGTIIWLLRKVSIFCAQNVLFLQQTNPPVNVNGIESERNLRRNESLSQDEIRKKRLEKFNFPEPNLNQQQERKPGATEVTAKLESPTPLSEPEMKRRRMEKFEKAEVLNEDINETTKIVVNPQKKKAIQEETLHVVLQNIFRVSLEENNSGFYFLRKLRNDMATNQEFTVDHVDSILIERLDDVHSDTEKLAYLFDCASRLFKKKDLNSEWMEIILRCITAQLGITLQSNPSALEMFLVVSNDARPELIPMLSSVCQNFSDEFESVFEVTI
jgi:hypothetical protein